MTGAAAAAPGKEAAEANSSRRIRGLFPAFGILIALLLALITYAAFRRAGVYGYVDGTPIEKPVVDFEKELILRGQGRSHPSEAQESAALHAAITQAIERELGATEAKRRGLAADPKIVVKFKAQVYARIKRFTRVAEFLSAVGLESKTLDGEIRKDVLSQLVRQEIAKKVPPPTEEELSAYYNERIEDFREDEATHLYAIFIKKPTDKEAADAARSRAEQILSEIEKGVDFQGLAAKESEGPGKDRGGDLGFVKRGFLPPALQVVVDSLGEGAVSRVVETADTFQILKVGERRRYGYRPFEEVRRDVTVRLTYIRRERAFSRLLHRLRARASITRYD